MSNDSALQQLRHRFFWPEKRPNVAPIDWSIDAGGRHLVVDVIRQRKLNVVLEIGVFVGNASPNP